MPIERRSRITLLLPAPTDLPEFLLLDDVLTELIQLCGGITVSSVSRRGLMVFSFARHGTRVSNGRAGRLTASPFRPTLFAPGRCAST